MKFQEETFRFIMDEFMDLIDAHKEEACAFGKDVVLDPNWTQYQVLELQGLLRTFTARNKDGRLVGYFIMFVHRHMHYDMQVATNDVVYMDKGYRVHAVKFFQFVEARLRDMGVKIMMFNIKQHVDYRPLAESLDFKLMEYIYFKRFD